MSHKHTLRQTSTRRLAPRSRVRAMVEALEERRLFSVLSDFSVGLPQLSFNGLNNGDLTYSAATQKFTATGTPGAIFPPLQPIGAPSSAQLSLSISSTGALLGSSASDLVIRGTYDLDGSGTIDPSETNAILIQGRALQFGFEDTPAADAGGNSFFNLRLQVTGGYLATTLFAGSDIGLEIVSEGSNYPGTFSGDFTGNTKAVLGPIPPRGGNEPAAIRGKKVLDLTRNGLTADDQGLAGFTIQLYKDNGDGSFTGTDTVFATAITAADGSYAFNGLNTGLYFVKEVNQAGYVQTGPAGGLYTVNLAAGTASTGNDFANFLGGSITGRKVKDLSGNGLSEDDTGLGGWTIQLYADKGTIGQFDAADTLITTTTTAAGTGAYAFTDLLPGKYIVREVAQSGYLQTWPVSGTYAVTVDASQILDLNAGTVKADVNGGNDFANFKKDDCQCSLACYYYVITSGCNTYTTTDLTGKVKQGDTVKVVFTLDSAATLSFVSYTAPNSCFEADKAYLQDIFDVKTGTFGKGTWSMTIKVPNCYFQVDFVCGLPIDQFGPAGSNIFYTPQCRLIDADNGGCTPCGDTVDNGDASIAGTVYADCNNNGIKETGEAGIKGVKVVLTGTTTGGTAFTLITYTDAYGNYKFANLKAGTYKVAEYQPSGYFDGKNTKGTAGGTLGNDVVSSIVLAAGTKATGYNFGELKAASLSGTVFFDKDRDGKIDCYEAGIGGVKLTLSGYDDLGNYVTRTTYTDSCGNYTFGDLRQGTYTLCEFTPSGFLTTKNTAGTEGGTVSGDKISNITVEWCDAASGYNFGEYKPYSYC